MQKINLDKCSNKLPLLHRVWKVDSHWPGYSVYVAGCLVSISLEDTCLPHCQGGGGQVAEGAQVQVARVAHAECGFEQKKC